MNEEIVDKNGNINISLENCKRNELYEENMKILAVKNQKQLAIQELAEVERLLYESHYKEIDNRYYAELEDIENLIDSRIQALEELKG